MAEAPTFEEIVRAWILSYDDRLPSDRSERIEALITLLGNLKDHQFEKEDLTTNRRRLIVHACVNPNHHKSKLKIWISMVLNALEAAIIIYYDTVKIRKDVVTPEMQAKIQAMAQKAEDTKKLRSSTDTPDDDNAKEDDDLLDIDQDLIEIDQAVKNAVDKKPEFEITDDFIKQHGLHQEVVWDDDFEKSMKELEDSDE